MHWYCEKVFYSHGHTYHHLLFVGCVNSFNLHLQCIKLMFLACLLYVTIRGIR